MATGWSHDFTEFQGGGAVEVEWGVGAAKGAEGNRAPHLGVLE